MTEEHTLLLETIDSIKQSIPEGKYLEITNIISNLYKKAEYTPHKIVYAVPILSRGTHSNIEDHSDECECFSYSSEGGMDIDIRSVIMPLVKLTTDSVFRKTGNTLILSPKLFPIVVPPEVLDLDERPDTLILMENSSKLKVVELEANSIIILSAVPV